MPEHIKLSQQNKENLNRLTILINASSTALANYLIAKGCIMLEEGFKKLDKDVLDAFKKALKK